MYTIFLRNKFFVDDNNIISVEVDARIELIFYFLTKKHGSRFYFFRLKQNLSFLILATFFLKKLNVYYQNVFILSIYLSNFFFKLKIWAFVLFKNFFS